MNSLKSLFFLTSILRSSDKNEIDELKRKICDDEILWDDVIMFANSNYLVPSLYYMLKKKELLGCIKDEQLKAYLMEVFLLNTERNQQILLQLKDICNIFSEINLKPLFLKGAVNLSEEDYSHVGMRCMTDIDIMVPEGSFEFSISSFKKAGYKESSYTDYKVDENHHHWDSMNKDGYVAALEIHKFIEINQLIVYNSKTSQSSKNSNYTNAYILNPTERIYHAFLHSEISHSYHKNRILALRHLYDFSILIDNYRDEIDWEQLISNINNNGFKKSFDSYLYTANKLFNLQTPYFVNSIYVKYHYKIVLLRIKKNRLFFESLYLTIIDLPKILGYKRMQKLYGITSPLSYPYSLIKYSLFLLKKYLLKIIM